MAGMLLWQGCWRGRDAELPADQKEVQDSTCMWLWQLFPDERP